MAERQPDLLKTITQVAGALAGLATVVYVTGAVVLGLRLARAGLSWGDVVSQLPREFVASIGAGQVLLPSVAVGAAYGLFRLLRDDHSNPPSIHRFREGMGGGNFKVVLKTMRSYNLLFLLMWVPFGALICIRLLRDQGEVPALPSWLVWLGAVVLLGTAIACHEVRAIAAEHYKDPGRWHSLKAATAMAVFYCLASIPAMTIAAASVSLTPAKVCKVGELERTGVLVGESSDRIYLAEAESDEEKRPIAVYPWPKVEELLVGPRLSEIDCHFDDAAPSKRR